MTNATATKTQTNDTLRGTYTNGITTWNFEGRVTSIHHDTAGGNFSTARIELSKPLDGRTALLMTLDANGEQADNRFNLN